MDPLLPAGDGMIGIILHTSLFGGHPGLCGIVDLIGVGDRPGPGTGDRPGVGRGTGVLHGRGVTHRFGVMDQDGVIPAGVQLIIPAVRSHNIVRTVAVLIILVDTGPLLVPEGE